MCVPSKPCVKSELLHAKEAAVLCSSSCCPESPSCGHVLLPHPLHSLPGSDGSSLGDDHSLETNKIDKKLEEFLHAS